MHWKELDVGRVWYSTGLGTFMRVNETTGIALHNSSHRIDIPSLEDDSEIALLKLGPLLIAGIM